MPGIEIVISERGLPIQRNTGLKFVAPQVSIVSFLDDDVELARDYLANIRSILDARSEIVLLDGAVVQDGNISRKEAIALLDQEKRSPGEHSDLRYASHAYGCNMTVRREVADRVLFDERLKLYAWLEDADFGRRCLAYGKCANAAAARIVHLAVKSGRVNSRQFGFAQIMNPYYLTKKGVVSRSSLLREHWWRALASNLLHLFRNDQEIDRIGRIKGNGLAWYLILRGRCEPEYIEKIQ
jgi:GT2 family glycosyltransferase